MSDAFKAKDVVLTRKRHGVMYDISPMTNSNMVYTDSETTLTETLGTINKDIDSRQPKEEGKGLSTNDFSDELCTKLSDGYSKNDIDEIVRILEAKLTRVEEI